MTANNELEGIWKEAVMISFEIAFHSFPAKAEGNHKKPQPA
jgi:hypothetical protein